MSAVTAPMLRESDVFVNRATANRGLFPGHERTHKELKEWWFAFQQEAARLGIPLRVVWGYRTWQQQDQLYRKGVGAPPGRSAHNFGLALDIIHTRRAWENMPKEGWAILGAMGHEVARKRKFHVQWGLYRKDGTHWDLAHWQMRNWRQLAGL